MNRSTFHSLRFAAVGLLAGASFSMATFASAESGTTVMSSSSSSAVSSVAAEDNTITPVSGSGINILPGEGTIIVEQKNGSGSETIGTWLLIKPSNEQVTGNSPTKAITNTSAGTYTVFAKLPTGASNTIRIYRNEKLETLVQRAQSTFVLQNGDTIRIVIHYTITKVGLIAVDSDPSGLDFHMTGPNFSRFTGTTPASFDNVAEGQYQVTYDPPNGCVQPVPQSLRLTAGNRISFSIKISCAAADKMRERQAEQTSNDSTHITINVDGKKTNLVDVPQDSWFAPYVANVAKYGILSGYTNSAGQLTGEYGPGNNVTVAELAKAAHKLAGVSVDSFQKVNPENLSAQNTWFSPFFASAENRGWTIYSSATVDPGRPATRGEVLVTLLQALDVPLKWQKGTMFTDVTTRTAYAAAIETAAASKVVSGRTDANGKATNEFGPADPINRAELAKVLSKMIDVYRSVSSSSAPSR